MYFKLIFAFIFSSILFAQCVGTGCPGSAATGVTTFNSRNGAVVPIFSDYPIVPSSPVGAPTYNIASGDVGKLITNINAFTLNLPTCATVGTGWYIYLSLTGTIILTVNNSETIDGLTASAYSSNVTSNQNVILFMTDGVKWLTTITKIPTMTGSTSSTNGSFGMVSTPQTGEQDLPLTGGATYITSTVGRFTGQTAAKTVLTKTSTVAADQSYLISANINVTTATAHSFTTTVTYTDETNTSQTQTLPFVVLAGTTLTTITNVTGAGPYEGLPIHIRCKANTTITVATVGTFTTVTYNVEAHIRHIK